METSWERLPAVESHTGPLSCGCCGARSDLPMDLEIAAGFGDANYSRDGEIMWNEGCSDRRQPPTVADVEALAKADPDHDWRIAFWTPLYDAEYQRQGDGLWVLIAKGEGFA
jgi:hypothetical protein